MALINCPECNQEISDQAAKCPKCGYPIKAEQRKEAVASAISAVGATAVRVKRKVPWKIVLIVAVALCVVVVGGFFIFRDFWARVFLDEKQYKAYKIHEYYKRETGFKSDCQEIYMPYNDDNMYMSWSENIEGYTIYYQAWNSFNDEELCTLFTHVDNRYFEENKFVNMLNQYGFIEDKNSDNPIIFRKADCNVIFLYDNIINSELDVSDILGAEPYVEKIILPFMFQ